MSCEACRTIPPVIPKGYTPKGTYQNLAGLNTCLFPPLSNIHTFHIPANKAYQT